MDFLPGVDDASPEFMQVSSKIEVLDRLMAKLLHVRQKVVILCELEISMKAVRAAFIYRKASWGRIRWLISEVCNQRNRT